MFNVWYLSTNYQMLLNATSVVLLTGTWFTGVVLVIFYLNINKTSPDYLACWLYRISWVMCLAGVLSLVLLSQGAYATHISCNTHTTTTGQPFNTLFGSNHLDELSLVFLATTHIISHFAFRVSLAYCLNEKKATRFSFLLAAFTLSMSGFVLSLNMVQSFFCWEMLGVVSFYLISFYDNKSDARRAAIKALVFNRFSDILFFLAIIWFFWLSNNVSWATTISLMSPSSRWPFMLIIFASFVKSAQSVFYFWLPDSMEAPLPASALIHSATLVSAGIFLVMRLSPLISILGGLKILCLTLLFITLLVFSVVTSVQDDIKRLLAFSTITNCSLMYLMVLSGYKYVALGFFTLHGLLKSACFLSASVLILCNNHDQAFIRPRVSNLFLVNFHGFFTFFVCCLGGVNITAAYTYKHLFLPSSPSIFTPDAFAHLCLVIYAASSVVYVIRILWCLYAQKCDFSKNAAFEKDCNLGEVLGTIGSYSFVISVIMVCFISSTKQASFFILETSNPALLFYPTFTLVGGLLIFIWVTPTHQKAKAMFLSSLALFGWL